MFHHSPPNSLSCYIQSIYCISSSSDLSISHHLSHTAIIPSLSTASYAASTLAIQDSSTSRSVTNTMESTSNARTPVPRPLRSNPSAGFNIKPLGKQGSRNGKGREHVCQQRRHLFYEVLCDIFNRHIG